ncbi:MAG: lytic transglycosylase, partial [Elusimicrobia bacterium]
KRKQVEPLLRRLLSSDARLRRSKFEETTPADVLEARGWLKTLPAEDRGAILEEAGKIWPGKLVVEEPRHAQPGPKARPVKAPPVKLAAMAPPTLLGDAAGTVYDGALFSKAEAPFLPGADDLKDAPAAVMPGAMPSTLPGAVRPEFVPPQPGAAAPPPVKDERPYAGLISREAAEAKVDSNILHALIAAMGGYKANRAEGGAYGLMMMTKGSAAWAGVSGDLRDPATNVRAGARLMAKLLKMFDGDVNRAVAAYRFGAGTVIKSGGLPGGREAKEFLGAFQKAYRGGSVKPPVERVEPPASGETRRAREEARAEAGGTPEAHRGGRQFAGSQRWKGLIAQAAGTFGVDPALIESILLSESEGRPSLVSSAGARGLMQLMPGTARALGVKNSFDPKQNIMGGTKYLKEMLNRFHGDKVLAVAAYNAGPNRQALRDGRVPNFRETVKYVTRVFARYEQITGEKVDSMAYMSGRGRAWAEREGAR